jgi:hypothetical protein
MSFWGERILEVAVITFVRKGTIAWGKTKEAMAFAHQVAKMAEEKVGIKVSIGMPIGGNPGRITWVASYDNLAAFESASTKLVTDVDYMKLTESAAPYFVGSVHDELWTWLPPEDVKAA